VSAAAALRGNVRLLGDTLGTILVEQEGEALLELVERVRGLSLRGRSGDEGAARELSQLVAELPLEQQALVLRAFALRLGAAPGALATAHIDALDALVVGWHGQGAVALPGGILVTRRAGRLTGPGTSAGTPAESHPPAG